jgi:hypothetical protein
MRLLRQEFVDAVISDECKIPDHAHVVFGSIALVECLQLRAREIGALITKPDFILRQQFALFLYESTLPVARQAAGAVDYLALLLFQIVRIGKVAAANPAVHPARGDQLCVECSLHLLLVNSYRFNDKRSLALYPEQVVASHMWDGRRQSNRI